MADAGEVKTNELDAEREALRRLALAQIRQYPDPALRMKAKPVDGFDSDLEALAERLKRLMRDANGLGLAATQIGVVRRVFAFQPPEEEPRVLVNPRLAERSEETAVDDEGCLSLQDVVVPVERHVSLTVEGNDPAGGEVAVELEGLAARVVQHELDHLDGVLLIDRTDPERRREALGILRPKPVLVSN